jgi:hypothetical protein
MGEITLVGNATERHLAGPKTSIMRKFITPLLLLCAHFAIGQKQTVTTEQQSFLNAQKHCNHKDCGCLITVPWTWISNGHSKRRIAQFNLKTTSCGMKGCGSSVRYSIAGMEELLGRIVNKVNGYDGVRAYFVEYPLSGDAKSGADYVPDNEYGKFAVIYVPTQRIGEVHKDDTSNIMVVSRNSVTTIPRKYASTWVSKAQGDYLAAFEKDGRRHVGDKFNETHSLWYSMDAIRGHLLGNGLYDIVHCRNCCQKNKYVDVWFAAFLDKEEYPYQLSLIFKLGNEDNNISMFIGDISRTHLNSLTKSQKNFLTESGGSDTGIPCPPPPGNCDGSLLP